jgi:hypothetical protein
MSVNDRLMDRGEVSECASGFDGLVVLKRLLPTLVVFRTGGQASELAARVLPSMS